MTNHDHMFSTELTFRLAQGPTEPCRPGEFHPEHQVWEAAGRLVSYSDCSRGPALVLCSRVVLRLLQGCLVGERINMHPQRAPLAAVPISYSKTGAYLVTQPDVLIHQATQFANLRAAMEYCCGSLV